MPRFRPRFSLLTALLLMTIVGMAIVLVQLWREVGPLRLENRQMRTELGQLTIDVASQVQAIEVRQPDPNLWRWRLYLPPGGKYQLLEFGGILPARGGLSNQQWLDTLKNAQHGIGSGAFSGHMLEGELTLEATLRKENDQWKFATHPGGGASHYVITDDWLADTARIDASDIWEGQQCVYEPGEPILLLYLPKPVRTPAAGGGTSLSMPKEPAEGIILWLEQLPAKPPTPPTNSSSP
jgi:hypothetical protein